MPIKLTNATVRRERVLRRVRARAARANAATATRAAPSTSNNTSIPLETISPLPPVANPVNPIGARRNMLHLRSRSNAAVAEPSEEELGLPRVNKCLLFPLSLSLIFMMY